MRVIHKLAVVTIGVLVRSGGYIVRKLCPPRIRHANLVALSSMDIEF